MNANTHMVFPTKTKTQAIYYFPKYFHSHSKRSSQKYWKCLSSRRNCLKIFERKEIGKLLKWRKEKGGHITWKELVVKFDLSENQAIMLKKKIIIED